MRSYKYYNLSGGIDLNESKTVLGERPKKVFWHDAKNVEIYLNSGLKRMNGNVEILCLPGGPTITGMFEYSRGNESYLVINTSDGKFYEYNESLDELSEKKSGLHTSAYPSYANFCNGIICSNGVDEPFFYEKGAATEVSSCNAVDSAGHAIRGRALTVYRGRVWIGDGGTLYYSGLGQFNNWSKEGDAGYIANFHNDSSKIVALSCYKEYLAIHKENQTYLLTGSSPDDFAIIPFADRGSVSPQGVRSVENSHYFFNNGVYTLEQVGELNQIRLSSEISKRIHPEFLNVDTQRLSEIIILPYTKKHQIWLYLPFNTSPYFHTCWIYDYTNDSWFKRVIPQKVTSACTYKGNIYIGTADGRIYQEDTGYTFAGIPIDFCWSSPFFTFSEPNRNKTITDLLINIDGKNENHFNFHTCKDFANDDVFDVETVKHVTDTVLIWDEHDWPLEHEKFCWNIQLEDVEFVTISGSNKSVQLNISGSEVDQDFAIIGFEFRDVVFDD